MKPRESDRGLIECARAASPMFRGFNIFPRSFPAVNGRCTKVPEKRDTESEGDAYETR